MADRWHLATIHEDWENDFPEDEKPARSWRDTIATLISMYHEDPTKAEAVRKAFGEGPNDTAFPFEIDLKEFQEGEKAHATRRGVQASLVCTKCEKETKSYAFCPVDGRRHQTETTGDAICARCGKETKIYAFCPVDGRRHPTEPTGDVTVTPDLMSGYKRHDEKRLHEATTNPDPEHGRERRNGTKTHSKEDDLDDTTYWGYRHDGEDEKLMQMLREIGGGAERYADALVRCGFSDLGRLDGINPDNLLSWMSPFVDMTPGDAVAIAKATKRQVEKKKSEPNPENPFDVRNFPGKLGKTGPDEITNTMHRILNIGFGSPEKKKLFVLFENWLAMLDKSVKAGRSDDREDLLKHGQELVNSIRALNMNAQGKPGTAILAQVEAKAAKDDFGAAVATWDARGSKTFNKRGGFGQGGKRFGGSCFACGKPGHRQAECRSRNGKGGEGGKHNSFSRPSQGTSGRAGR